MGSTIKYEYVSYLSHSNSTSERMYLFPPISLQERRAMVYAIKSSYKYSTMKQAAVKKKLTILMSALCLFALI